VRILVPDAPYSGEPDIEHEALGADAVIEIHRAKSADDIPAASWEAADAAMLADKVWITPAVIARMARCRIVVRVGVGYDKIDAAACAARGIAVCNVPDYGTGEVADHALALALALRRGVTTYTSLLAADPVAGWKFSAAPLLRRLDGQVFGVVGLGRIGRAAATRARGFGMQVIYYDPYVSADDPGAALCRRVTSLDELAEAADIVSLHVPLTPETRGMIGAAQLARMQPHAILINTARGPVVDTAALAEALRAGRPGGAGLDVLPQEPPAPDDKLVSAWRQQPAWLAGRLILTPHAAFYSPQSWRELRRKGAETVRDFLLHGRLRNCVNAELLRSSALQGVPQNR
jgi:phosphoglycerate dehydrogenase-like enzyme